MKIATAMQSNTAYMLKHLIFIFCALTMALATAPAFSQEPQDSTACIIRTRINSVIEASPVLMERSQVGIYVYDLTADSAIYARGHHQQMRPASCQKVLTAVAALHELGSKHAFRTTLAVCPDTLRSDSLRWYGKLIVRGGMDPSFDSTDLHAMAEAVRRLGADTIVGNLIIDLDFKDDSRLGWGWCWDDKNPSLSPLLCDRHDDFAGAFVSVLRQRGIIFKGSVELGSMPAGAQVICTRVSSIDEILDRMMKRSDNLYAESLFYQLGRTHKRASAKVTAMLTAAGATSGFLQVADGSGLSLYNYTTPEALVLALRFAHQRETIYRHLLASLPIAGEDGTLSARMTSGAAKGNVRAKTGTVEGISSLAGYATAPNGHLLAFAIINQGIRKTASGRDFQDAVCQAMCQAQ